MKKSIERVRPTPSAIMNANQTFSSIPVEASSTETGRSTASCLTIDTIIEAYPIPVAWNIDVRLIEIAAGMKQRDMILNAGFPILSISAEAAKNERSTSGSSWKMRKPMIITHTAMISPTFSVFSILSFFFAP